MTAKKIFILLSTIFLLTILILAFVNYQKLNDLNLDRIRTRRSYFPAPLGRIYENKLTEAFILSRIQVFSLFKL